MNPRRNLPPHGLCAGRLHSSIEGRSGAHTLPAQTLAGRFAMMMLLLCLETAAISVSATQVVAWGDNTWGQTNVPPDLTNAVAIASADNFNMALRSDGTVVAWGDNGIGQTNVPPDLTNVVAIRCSHWVCVALKGDGTVVGWGANGNGQATGSTANNAVAVSTANGQSLALLNDGTVVQWGQAGRAPLGSDTNNIRAIASDGNSDEDVVHLLHVDGTVTTYGSLFPAFAPVPPDLTNAVAISTTDNRVLALRSDGTVEEWGFFTNTMPDGLSNVVAIADETALKSDGTIAQWTGNTPPPGLSNVVAITSTLALIGDAPPITHARPTGLTRQSTAFSLTVPTQNNQVFGLEYKNALTAASWSTLPLVAGTGTNMVLSDTTASGSQRFYRVRRW